MKVRRRTIGECMSWARCLASWRTRRNSSMTTTCSSIVNELPLTLYDWRNGSSNWRASSCDTSVAASPESWLSCAGGGKGKDDMRPQGLARNLANEKRTRGSSVVPIRASLSMPLWWWLIIGRSNGWPNDSGINVEATNKSNNQFKNQNFTQIEMD